MQLDLLVEGQAVEEQARQAIAAARPGLDLDLQPVSPEVKTVDQDERGNAERRALFVGLWPPTIWLIGDSLGRLERRRRWR